MAKTATDMPVTASFGAVTKRLFMVEKIAEKYQWEGVAKGLIKMLLPESMIWSWSKRSWERHAWAAREILKSIDAFIE